MSKLTLVGIPIGNLEDISLRSFRFIFESQVVLAEDTRAFSRFKGLIKQKYLNLFSDLTNLPEKQIIISYREQNHENILETVLAFLKDGKEISLFSDAGMPGISDPGFKLVDAVMQNGFEVDVVPGPTAVTSALAISGLASDKFTFLGFLPRTRGKVVKIFETFLNVEISTTIVVYESPFRVVKLLSWLAETCTEKGINVQVSAVSEISKLHQKVFRGDVNSVLKDLKKLIVLKGEWVICFRVSY